MSRLAAIQDQFQRAIIGGDDAVITLLPDGAKQSRDVLLGVYRNAYLARIVDILRTDHAMLHVYLGDETFDDMVGAYIAAHPSRTPNARWISRQVPTFLASREPYCEHAEIADLAAIEQTLNDAFDAADATSISLFDLSSVDPQAWPDLVFTPHPSIRRLALRSNAFDIWSALAHDAEPPEALEHKCAQHVIVWRAEGTAMLRILGREEAMMWDEAANGVRFGVLCEMVATNDAPDTAAMRAATYLRGWIEGGLLATATMRPRHQR